MKFNLQRITAEDAEAEPESDRLFGPSWDARQARLRAFAREAMIDRESYKPWDKPTVQRAKSTGKGA